MTSTAEQNQHLARQTAELIREQYQVYLTTHVSGRTKTFLEFAASMDWEAPEMLNTALHSYGLPVETIHALTASAHRTLEDALALLASQGVFSGQ